MENKKEKINHGFTKASDISNSKPQKNHTFLKNVCVPFLSGIVGTSLVLGLCFYVPSVRNIFTTEENSKETNPVAKIFQSEGSVSKAVDIKEYSDTAIMVANKVLPSVVGIEVKFSISANYPTFSAATQSMTSKATGSGVIISEDGYILTNNHVIDTSSSSSNFYSVSDADKVLVYLTNEEEPVEAKIIGADSVTDLAVLKIEKEGLTAVEFGDSDSIKIGEFSMAIGNPLEMRNTVTTGIISAINREITDSSGTMYSLIQTDAAINSGNSGGALVNADGKLIGINTLKMSGSGIEGMGFAIPINSTIDITEQLISTGKVKRPYIGISGSDVNEMYSIYYKIPVGIYVAQINNDGPAKNSDLKIGDVITKFNGNEVKTMSELNNQKNKCNIGDKVKLTISRENEELEIEITLTEQP